MRLVEEREDGVLVRSGKGKTYVNWSPTPHDSELWENLKWTTKRAESNMTDEWLDILME